MSKTIGLRKLCMPVARGLRGSVAALLLICATLAAPAPSAWAAEEMADVVRDDAPSSYLVQEGDTLWGIAGRFLNQPWMWPDLWRANPEIADPHLIFPGDTVRLGYVDGMPALMLERGNAGRTMRMGPSTDVKLEPRIRAEPLLSSVPTIAMSALYPFLSSNRVVTEGELAGAPYVIAGEAERILVGPGDRFYARGYFGGIGTGVSIVRRDRAYTDPDDGRFLGIEALEVGSARVVAVANDIATLQVIESSQSVNVGDKLMPVQERSLSTDFFPDAPDVEVAGRIIAVVDGLQQIGTYNTVVLNRGAADGLKQGDVLAVLKEGELVRDRIANEAVRLPPTRGGLLLVLRTYDLLAYGIVLQADVPLAVGDQVANP